MAVGTINFDLETEEPTGRYPKATVPVLQAQADILRNKGDYHRAIKIYSDALTQDKKNKACLLGRSHCQVCIGECGMALRDADVALKDDPDCYKSLYTKAEALYNNGDFEEALVYYHRGSVIRPDLYQFTRGIYKANEALEHSVGKKANVQLTKEGDMSFFAGMIDNRQPALKAGKMNTLLSKLLKKGGGGKKDKDPADVIHGLVYKELSKNAIAKRLLGRIYRDKIYIRQYFKVNDHTTDAGVELHKLMFEALAYLAQRSDFWRQRQPLYSKQQKRTRHSIRFGGRYESKMSFALHKEMEKITEMCDKRHIHACIKRAKKLLDLIGNLGSGSISNRELLVACLHNTMGNAYLDIRHYQAALHHHKIDRHIGEQHNMPDIVRRARDNLGRCYARMGEYEKAIEIWGRNLPGAETNAEIMWLHHEIGRCHLELGRHTQAIEHGQKAAERVDDEEDPVWEINVSILMAQALFRSKNYNAAHHLFERALNHTFKHEELIDRGVQRALHNACVHTMQKMKDIMEKDKRKRKPPKHLQKDADKEEDESTWRPPMIHHPPDYRQSFSFKSPLLRELSPSLLSASENEEESSPTPRTPRSPGKGTKKRSPSPMSLLSVGERSGHASSSVSSVSRSLLSDTSSKVSTASGSSTESRRRRIRIS